MANIGLYIDIANRTLIKHFNSGAFDLPLLVCEDTHPIDLFFFEPDPVTDGEYISKRYDTATFRVGIGQHKTDGYHLGTEADSFSEVVPDSGSITVTDLGSYPSDAGYSGRTIFSLDFSDRPAGGTFVITWQINLAPGRDETRTVTVSALATPAELRSTLIGILGPNITVQGTAGVQLIVDAAFGSDTDSITVDDSNVAWGQNYGWTGTLDLTDARLIALVGATAQVSMTLEVELTDGATIISIQTPVQVAAKVIAP